MKVCWLGGWGLPASYTLGFAVSVLPDAQHEVLLPTRECSENLDTSRYDAVVAYSLGAMMLLDKPEALSVAKKVVLVAPFYSFCAESGRGGKTPVSKVRYLARWLQREPLAALGDFYSRAALQCEVPLELPYALEDMSWGLEQLATQSLPCIEISMTSLVGDKDALLNATDLAADFRDLTIVTGAGHCLTDFSKEVSDALR